MVTKKYGINGYLEFSAEIKVGKATLSIPFTGGAMTLNGVYPATYTSTNEVEQAMIEHSPKFRSGQIFIIAKYGEPDVKPETTPVAKAEEPTAAEAEAEPVVEEETSGNAIRFTSLADAKEFLAEKGIDISGIRLKSDAIELAKSHGIDIEFNR